MIKNQRSKGDMKLGTLFYGIIFASCLPAFAQVNPSLSSPSPSNSAATSSIYSSADTEIPASQQPPAAYGLQQSSAYTMSPAEAHADSKKPFTVSATIREAYDDNIYTTHTGKVDQFETIAEPSFLFNYPMEDTLFSARYTFGATYYPDRSGSSFDLSHDFLGRINHSFSDRFNLDVRDRILNTDQPQVSSGATVNRVAGSFVNNTFTLQGTAQWLPKFNTVTTYTNDYFTYDDPTQSLFNDRDVNVLQNDFRFLLTPVTTLVVGGTFNDVSYFHNFVPFGGTSSINRNWDSYTGYVGVDYNAAPSVLLGTRLGGVETTYEDSSLSSNLSPYAEAFVNWQIGARSTLNFDYTHTVAQTDVNNYDTQISDNFSITGRYQIAPKISTRLQGDYNIGLNQGDSSVVAGSGNFHEDTLGLDYGIGYDLTQYLNINFDYTFTHVTSDEFDRAYTRNQISLGLTATY